jgi:hypothetical protein
MNVEFVTNDYLLAWNLLFRPSISEEIQKLKERLWKNYPELYMKLEKENVEILKYTKDFIPDDDTIYNYLFNSDEFAKVKKETEKYRQFLLKIWDEHSKEIQSSLKELFRFKVEDTYQILVVHPHIDNVEYLKKNPKKNVVWGKKEDTEDGVKAIIRILFTLIRYEIGDYQTINREIVSAIIDMLVSNELYSRLSDKSRYEEGIKKLKLLKRQIYPYWLMYQGCKSKEDLVSRMMKDQVAFDIDKYEVTSELEKLDLYGFIDFCCNNQNYIIRLSDLENI